mgnify:FL=1
MIDICRFTLLLVENIFLYTNGDKQSHKNITRGGGVMFETLPEVLTLKQCQEILQIGRTTIIGMIQRNELRAFKVRGHWRIRKDDLLHLIN